MNEFVLASLEPALARSGVVPLHGARRVPGWRARGPRRRRFGCKLRSWHDLTLSSPARHRSRRPQTSCCRPRRLSIVIPSASGTGDPTHGFNRSTTSAWDVAVLRAAGFAVETLSRGSAWDRDATFRRARVRHASGGHVEIDWAADSAFRFFPIEPDPELGWRLYLFDAATNKALTLAARTETRDYVDIVELGQRFPLAAVCWAACGKDPGFAPLSLLAMMRRFARVDPVELDKIRARAIDPVAEGSCRLSSARPSRQAGGEDVRRQGQSLHEPELGDGVERLQ